MMSPLLSLLLIFLFINNVSSYYSPRAFSKIRTTIRLRASEGTIVSPFDSSRTSTATAPSEDKDDDTDDDDEELPLTIENVERVLDEMRPYLQSDGFVTLQAYAASFSSR